MAKRPLFSPCIEEGKLVDEILLEFKWYAGVSISQKQKSILSLHEAAFQKGYCPILEISSKSPVQIGKQLSAFNLQFETIEYGTISIEAAFQGSKVFTKGGPFTDLYSKSGWEIKKDLRLKESGDLCGFLFLGEKWNLEPKTAFYDWLYIHALDKQTSLADQIIEYKGFTDIEFNPKKSINCQARACALYVSLYQRKQLAMCLGNQREFIQILTKDSKYQSHSRKQESLFD